MGVLGSAVLAVAAGSPAHLTSGLAAATCGSVSLAGLVLRGPQLPTGAGASSASGASTIIAQAGSEPSRGGAAARLTPTARVISPPRPGMRTGINTGTTEICLSAKKGGRRRRRRPGPGRGGAGDDNWGGDDGGNNGGDHGGGGGNWEGWGDGGNMYPPSDRAADLLVLWYLACFFSLLQTLHFAICRLLGTSYGDEGALFITNALFGGGSHASTA